VKHRGHLPTTEVETLRAAGVTDQEIVEVIATVAVNIFTNYFNHIADTEIDFPVVHAAEPPTR
jgi:alkylhydroperoxidase family enzyme